MRDIETFGSQSNEAAFAGVNRRIPAQRPFMAAPEDFVFGKDIATQTVIDLRGAEAIKAVPAGGSESFYPDDIITVADKMFDEGHEDLAIELLKDYEAAMLSGQLAADDRERIAS